MKIVKLVKNETIKTFKKTSTKIMIILVLLSLFAAIGLAKLVMLLNDMPTYYSENIENWQDRMKEDIASMKKEIETDGIHYDKESIAVLKAQMETYQIALECNINYVYYFNFDNWKIQLLNQIQEAKEKIILNGGIQGNKIIEMNGEIVTDRVNLLKKDDFSGYIELLKKDLKTSLENKEISKEEYDEQIYLLDIQKKYEIYKEDEGMFDWKGSLYEDISAIKKNLRTGINSSTGKLLKIEEIEELENSLKIAEYRLENNIPVLSSGASARSMYDIFAPSFSIGLLSILMIIISGSAISTEISKGTIKFLLFTPNKRWKVLLSKIISAILILATLTLILSILSTILGNIFFEEDGIEYVYVQNGEAKSIPNMLYTILYFFASSIDIAIYMIFGFMLSVITRNTALSVGVSIACYIGSGIVMQLINYYISADWIKFIPFNNLGLADRIFANNISYVATQSMPNLLSNLSIGFSLSVLAVCSILMLITMFDSFNKRDIV